MKSSQLIEKNNQLRLKLDPQNKKFYDDLLVYIRIKGLVHDEHAIETALITILEDLLDAQTDGIPAEQYFGKNTQSLANDLITAIPVKPFELIKLLLVAISTYFLVVFLPTLVNPQTPVDLGNIILVSIYVSLVVLGILKYIGNTIYPQKRLVNHKIIKFFILLFSCMLILAPIFLINIFVKTPFRFYLPAWLGIGVILIFTILGLLWFMKQTEKKPLLPFVTFLLAVALLGVTMRLPLIGDYLTNTQLGHYLSAGFLIIFLLIFKLLSFLTVKDLK